MYIPHTRCVIATTVLILAVGVVVASGEGLRAPSLATGFTGAQIHSTWGSPMKDKCNKYLEKVHDRLTHVYASKACKGPYCKGVGLENPLNLKKK